VFADTYITEEDAESTLSSVSSISSVRRGKPTSAEAETSTELSTIKGNTNKPIEDNDYISYPEIYERMMLDSQPYLCSIPQVVTKPQNATEAAMSKADEAREIARATDRGFELLKELDGKCLYFISGWWSYSFCYGKEVKQYHQLPPGRDNVPIYPPIEDPRVPSYVLGSFQGYEPRYKHIDGQQVDQNTLEATAKAGDLVHMQSKGDMRYLVQKLDHGTMCDLTGRPRKIEVQFHCHPQSDDRIGFIKEVSTCSYLMIIYTPRLCNDVAFLPPKENKAHQIICKEIVPEGGAAAWRLAKAAENARKLLDVFEGNIPKRQMIGDIELGGQKLVGQPGQRIEPPKSNDRQDRKADVLMRWHPKKNGGKVQKISDSEIEKLDLNPQALHQLKEEMIKDAKGKPWKLEIVDTAEGDRELRGIVEDEEDEALQREAEGTAAQEGEKKKGGKEGEAAGVPAEEEQVGSQEVFKDEL
jgi:hypothetical protein